MIAILLTGIVFAAIAALGLFAAQYVCAGVEPLPDGPAPVRFEGVRGHVGLTEQVDGTYAVGFALRVGRTSGTQLTKIAELAAEYGQGRIRTTAQQQLVILDVPADRTDALIAELAAEDLPVHPSPFREGTMACTGIEFCKLAIVDTKERARDLVAELERRFPDLDSPITVNVNGCPNACARTQVADIGLKGQLVMHEGQQVEGFQVHLGGATGLQANFGRKLRAHKVTSTGLDDYISSLVVNYLADRKEAESFAGAASSRPAMMPAIAVPCPNPSLPYAGLSVQARPVLSHCCASRDRSGP